MTTKIRIPLEGTEDSFELEVHLVCMICGATLERSPRYDRGKKQAFVCPGAHPSHPVYPEVKVSLDGVDPVDA